jgi:hypothetical protein
VTRRSDWLTVSAMPPPEMSRRDRFCYVFASFLIFFLDFFFRKNLRLRICFFFYLFFGLKN